MKAKRDFDAEEFADRLAAMTDDELFGLMQRLEAESEEVPTLARDTSEVFAKIALVESERDEQPTAFGVDGIAIALSFRTSALPALA
uniref:hypothetical protein n=1 Tax=Ensifer adhaerens TaxID=106592 RepID=UPI003F494B1A